MNQAVMMKKMLGRIQADITRSVFLGEPVGRGDATTCAPPTVKENLTVDSLLDTIGSFQRQQDNPLGMISGMQMREDIHLTVSQEKWIRARRSWRTRLFGGSISFLRASAMLVVLLLAASSSGWFALALPVLSLRPRRLRVVWGPRKIYEQVPDLNYYVMGEMIVAHPVTMARLKNELSRMEPKRAPRLFARPLNMLAPTMTRDEYRRIFGVQAAL